MTTFLIIGAIGFIFLLLSFIIGDIFEAVGIDLDANLDGSGDFGLFDSRVVSMFLTSFGGFGALAIRQGFGVFVGILSGIVGGIIFGALVYHFGKFLYRQQASSSVTAKDLIGRSAQVSVAIKPNQIGQVTCLIGEERVEKLARVEDDIEIKLGETVRIENINGETLTVKRIDEDDYFLTSGKRS